MSARYRLLVTVAVLLLSGALPAAAAADRSVEEVIEAEMAASGAPGVAYAVVTDGELAMVAGHGVVDSGGDTEVTSATPFVIGSISKSFTALAIMQLVEAGDVELDSGIDRYLPSFDGRPAGAITVRQLLGHLSGFSTLQGNSSHLDATGEPDDLARGVDGVAAVGPAYAPGERWEYSNTNYQILGRLIEVVSGEDYQSYVEGNILEPLGMADSFVADGEIHDSMATGHRPWFGTKRPVAEQRTDRLTAPQGGIVASSRDLGRYLTMMVNGEDDVLSAEGKALMLQPADAAAPYYGFGWYLNPAEGTVWHSGATPGFETLITIVPDERSGAVVLVNAGSGLGFGETTRLREGIIATALDLEQPSDGSRWPQKTLFVSMVVLPIAYAAAIVWAWRRRVEVRAKAGPSGLFSWWFPLLTTGVSAWVILWLVPRLFGSPLRTIALFQPDFGLALVATAVSGVVWAVFRLAVAYTGGPRPTPRSAIGAD